MLPQTVLLLVVVATVARLPANAADVPPPAGASPEHFTIFGRVERQGRYELPANQVQPLTVTGAISMAGSFASNAKTHAVKVVRRIAGANKTIIINADDILNRGMKQKDISVKHGDVIIVDEQHVEP